MKINLTKLYAQWADIEIKLKTKTEKNKKENN